MKKSDHTAFFVDDFHWAVIRLATLQIKQRQPGRLLFATVTLLTPCRPPPSKMVGVERQKLGKSGMTVYFRRTVLDAQSAVDWYRSLGGNDSKTPTPSRPEDVEESLDGISITASDLVDDPLWPNVGCPMGESLLAQSSGKINPVPFLGSAPARVHRRFGNAEGFEPFLANEKALAFSARRLHINLRDYPEYLGSAALVVPDPIIKQIDNFLIPASDECGERIFYRFVPRLGQNLDGLKITMFDEQAHLLSSFEIREIPADGILDVDKGSCLGAYGYIVTHPVHGILTYHPPAGFIRAVNLNIGIVNQVRKVSVPMGESSKSSRMEYRVRRIQNDRSSIVGEEPTAPNMNVRVGLAARQREKAADAARFDQHWFGNGARQEAMAFVRMRVGRARSRIMVADPYFGVLQVPQYLLAITSDVVKVRILTSRLAFEGGCSIEDGQEGAYASLPTNILDRLGQFSMKVEQLKKEGNAEVDVMVLPGKSPILHDRFLVVDDDVWFLGNSLNTLGERASMIIKLPNPDEVLRELDKMLMQAETFDTYCQRTKKALESVRK